VALLEAIDLVKTFGSHKAVNRVSLHVNAGETVGLLGRNGAGKTTTFKMVVGLLQPDGGKVLLDGADITRHAMYQRVRMGLGYLSQKPALLGRMSVKENLTAILELRGIGKKERERQAAEILEEFAIAHVATVPSALISGGEKRRLEIGRCLAMQPRLVLLDEPFANVDPIGKTDVRRAVDGLRARGVGVLITDHEVEALLKSVDRAYIVDNGQVLKSGTPDEVVADPKVRDTYLGDVFEWRGQRLGASTPSARDSRDPDDPRTTRDSRETRP
jgi:lipopolysaccharide export system ATP-binding protein